MRKSHGTQKLLALLRKASLKLWRKGILYWAVVVVLIFGGTWLGHWLEEQDFALDWRYKLSQVMQSETPREPFIQRTVLVLINDDEYWKGELARRVPIKRDYLAKLVEHLDHAEPAVIALDFDLRSPVPDGNPIEHENYNQERLALLEVIKRVSQNPNRWIILPRTIRWQNGSYVAESDIHAGFEPPACNIKKGYIQLPYDIRKIPLSVHLNDGTQAQSFAQAIVSAVNDRALKPTEGKEQLPYGSYLKPEAFEQFSATDVINENPEAFKKFRHNIVIVGAGWSRTAYGRGGPADSFSTPVGTVRGALLHANFVEALLDNRTSPPWSEHMRTFIEILLAVALALAFALLDQPLGKGLALIALVVVLIIFSYFSQLNLGHFYDFSIPLILIALHAIYEQIQIILEWRSEARKHAHAKS